MSTLAFTPLVASLLTSTTRGEPSAGAIVYALKLMAPAEVAVASMVPVPACATRSMP